MQVLLALPRVLDRDMVQATGLTANEYKTLMHLSEAPHHELRMAELANATALSASRMTRLVDDLQARGLVSKRTSKSDGRGSVATLDPSRAGETRRCLARSRGERPPPRVRPPHRRGREEDGGGTGQADEPTCSRQAPGYRNAQVDVICLAHVNANCAAPTRFSTSARVQFCHCLRVELDRRCRDVLA